MKKSFFLIVFSLLTALTIWADDNDKTSSIDISSLPAGVYVVTYSEGESVIENRKFVKR